MNAAGTIIPLTSDGAWTWFNDPRAICQGQTLITGWVTSRGDVQVASFHLASRRLSIATLHAGFQSDDHDNPSFLAEADGSITAFYTRHQGEHVWQRSINFDADSAITLGEESVVPHDQRDVAGASGWTYANPIRLRNDGGSQRTYLGSRGPNYSPVFRVRAPDGRWMAAHNFVQNVPHRPYVKYDSNGLDRISFAYTDGHPGAVRSNVYFATMRDGTYFRADGSRVKDIAAGPITMADSSTLKVFDGDNAWVWDVATTRDLRPVVAFASFHGARAQTHRLHWARWDGIKWVDRILVDDAGGSITETGDEPHYSGGIALDHANPNVAYLSRFRGPGRWEIEQWRTTDAGSTWSSLAVTELGRKSSRPSVPRGLPAGLNAVLFLSGSYSYWDFSKPGRGFGTAVYLWIKQ